MTDRRRVLDAERYGRGRGYDFGSHVDSVSPYDKKEACCDCNRDNWLVFCEDCAIVTAGLAEMNDRQFSSFCNRTARWSEEQFEAYEKEMSSSLVLGVQAMLKEKYGFVSVISQACGAQPRERDDEAG